MSKLVSIGFRLLALRQEQANCFKPKVRNQTVVATARPSSSYEFIEIYFILHKKFTLLRFKIDYLSLLV